MKTKEKYLQYPVKGILFFSILILLAFNFVGCNASSDTERIIAPPDPTIETAISNYYPDSGGVATKLILHGTNFGTDTAYIKVYVNNKKAALENSVLKAEIERMEKELHGEGRILVRPSGTEPLVRVMVEAATLEKCHACVEPLVELIQTLKL